MKCFFTLSTEMVSPRKICIITGTRAEYGLLYWLMREVQKDPDLHLQIIATGMHVSPEFGLTYRSIESDGFVIDAKVEMLLSSDTPQGIAKSMGIGVIGFSDALARLKPDMVVMLGDRFELLAAAQVAMVLRIPIAHLSGGEATEGLMDEAIRHCLTKMAHVHFVSAEPYRKKVIQLGERPESVFHVGTTSADNIQNMGWMDRKQFEEAIAFSLGEINFLVTYHPVTLKQDHCEASFKQVLQALNHFETAKIIFTKSNSDTEGRILNPMIDRYVADHPHRAIAFMSLGQKLYLNAIRHMDVVIGNSSSGIIEVPFLNKPTVNIGDRQKGRLRASSIIDCDDQAPLIIQAIDLALSFDFKKKCAKVDSPYGGDHVSVKIKEQLKNLNLDGILFKKFYEVNFKY